MRQLLRAVCTMLICAASVRGIADGAPSNPALRAELLRREHQDEAIRDELIRKGMEHPDQTALARMNAIDGENSARLKEIVDQYGWPNPALVGQEGAGAAFSLAQHANASLQRQLLPLLEKAFKSGDLPGQRYALFLDRVLLSEGKPQIYGTQTKPTEEWQDGEPAFLPIEDPTNVDQRRSEIGLPPMAQYKELLKQMYFPDQEK